LVLPKFPVRRVFLLALAGVSRALNKPHVMPSPLCGTIEHA